METTWETKLNGKGLRWGGQKVGIWFWNGHEEPRQAHAFCSQLHSIYVMNRAWHSSSSMFQPLSERNLPQAKKIERIERGLVILWWYGYGSIPIDTFLVGWTSINPSTFGVHQGYKVLTHSHIVVIRGLVEIGREMSGLPSGSFLHRQHGRPVQSCHGLHWSIQIGVDQKWWFPWDLWLAK